MGWFLLFIGCWIIFYGKILIIETSDSEKVCSIYFKDKQVVRKDDY